MAKKKVVKAQEKQFMDDACYVLLTMTITDSIYHYGGLLLEPLEVCLIKVGRENPTLLKQWLCRSGTNSIETLAMKIKADRDTSADGRNASGQMDG